MNGDLVSVLVPSYNMAAFLPFAVDSVLAQTYPHLEVHVVDDGSSDSTRTVMERYAADKRVHYHYQPNAGLPAARNTGLRHARGSIVGLCDADDMWVPDKLESQLPLFTTPDVGVVYTDAQWMDVNGQLMPTRAWGTEYRVSGKITDELFVRNVVTGSTSLIRRECFDSVGPYDETLTGAEDYELWLRISTRYSFVYLDRITYHYRQWGGQMSGNSIKMLDNCARILEGFQRTNGHQISPRVVADAWARLRTDRAMAIARDGDRRRALGEVATALRHNAMYRPAWKAALKILMDRVPRSNSWYGFATLILHQ